MLYILIIELILDLQFSYLIIRNETKVRLFVYWIKQNQYSNVTWRWLLIEVHTTSLTHRIYAYNVREFSLNLNENWWNFNQTYKSAAHDTCEVIQTGTLKLQILLEIKFWIFFFSSYYRRQMETNRSRFLQILLTNISDQLFWHQLHQQTWWPIITLSVFWNV